jgi:hypothetical protein
MVEIFCKTISNNGIAGGRGYSETPIGCFKKIKGGLLIFGELRNLICWESIITN